MNNSIPQTSAVYKITCKPTGKIYIGSSQHLRTRWNQHINHLKAGVHHNHYLQRAFDKYGEENFEIEILELVMPWMLLEREDYWLQKMRPFGDTGFNLHLSAEGSHMSKESIEKMRQTKIGKSFHTEEMRAKQSAFMKGNSFGKALKGKKNTPEHCANISAGLKGKKKTPEHNANNSKSHTMYNYVIESPDGDVFYTDNMRQFCREHGLYQSNMAAVARGEKKQYKGWKCRYA